MVPPPLLYAPGLDPLALGLRTSQPGGEWERMAEGGLGLGPASCCVPLNCLIVSYHDNCLAPPPPPSFLSCLLAPGMLVISLS